MQQMSEWRRRATLGHPGESFQDLYQGLQGARILVVEDEPIIAMELQSVFEDKGAVVVGPARTLEAALRHAGKAQISAAVLDLRLGPEPIAPVARLLRARDIPFLFYSGQPRNDPLRAEWPEALFLSKPATTHQLMIAVLSLLELRQTTALHRGA